MNDEMYDKFLEWMAECAFRGYMKQFRPEVVTGTDQWIRAREWWENSTFKQ